MKEQLKGLNVEEKKSYDRMMRKAKLDSWKQYCRLKSENNSWNSVYHLSTGKAKNTP